MNQVALIPADDYGYNFIKAPYIPDGKDEYYLRNIQCPPDLNNWRPLTDAEISALEKNANYCAAWSDVLVKDPFDVSKIRNNYFHGLVRIGKVENTLLRFHDFAVPAGITNSRIISCDIGDNCAVHNCSYLAFYIIRDRVILNCVEEMQTTNHAKFGNGIIKDGEDESVRIWIDPINEAGGRSVLPFESMICADAYLWAVYRDDQELTERLAQITQNSFDSRRGWYGEIGADSVIKSCNTIKDVVVGECAYIKGAHKLKNLTIRSNRDEPAQIGEGVELVNGIINYGCHIFYGCKAVRFVMGNNSNLKYGARLIHSILGDNSTISCCEVLNNLVFPGHEQHHNNSFLIASLIKGQSNMAAGATVGSNHNSRGNDGEIIAGRGFWPGLSSTLKHNCRFASYTLIAKGNYPAELDILLPFSMLCDNAAENRREIMPAYYWMYNMYALERNAWKYRARDKRLRPVQRVEYDYLAPDTAEEIRRAMKLLETWVGAAKTDRILNEASNEDTEKARAAGRDCIINSPEELADLTVYGVNVERSKQPVKILKPADAWRAYKQMLVYYSVRTIAEYCHSESARGDFNGTAPGFDAAQRKFASEQPRSWINMGGQLMPEFRADDIRRRIRSRELDDWDAIHAEYERCWRLYPLDKAADAFASLRYVTERDLISEAEWRDLRDNFYKTREYIENQARKTKEKDYTNYFRSITYRNDKERDAVLGCKENNPFIKYTREETERLSALVKALRF